MMCHGVDLFGLSSLGFTQLFKSGFISLANFRKFSAIISLSTFATPSSCSSLSLIQ